jgi:hypothetical protein
MPEVRNHLTTVGIDAADLAVSIAANRRQFGHNLTDEQQTDPIKMLQTGVPVAEIASIFKISTTAVYKHRSNKTTSNWRRCLGSCVPTACQTPHLKGVTSYFFKEGLVGPAGRELILNQ